MKLPSDWNDIPPADESKTNMPPDAYVVKIYAAEITNGRIQFKLDINDGEFKDYFSEDWKKRMEYSKNGNVFWRLNYSVPVDFDDVNHGYFFKRLFKRFVNTLEASNKNFKCPMSFDPTVFVGKIFVALIDMKEKQSSDGFKVYQNYYVRREYTLKQLANGEIPTAEIEDVNGNRRKVGEEPPPKDPNNDSEMLDDVDIPF